MGKNGWVRTYVWLGLEMKLTRERKLKKRITMKITGMRKLKFEGVAASRKLLQRTIISSRNLIDKNS